MSTIQRRPIADIPTRTTARHLGMEAFLQGLPLLVMFPDQYRQEQFEEGYEREKGDWYQRPM